MTDLGVWNIFWNPDFSRTQIDIWKVLCEEALQGDIRKRGFFKILRTCNPWSLLPKAIGSFKTPGLRDLSHSAPYFHTGMADTLEEVIRNYIRNAELARQGQLRSGDRRMSRIALTEEDIAPLVAFLKSLNEDYE